MLDGARTNNSILKNETTIQRKHKREDKQE